MSGPVRRADTIAKERLGHLCLTTPTSTGGSPSSEEETSSVGAVSCRADTIAKERLGHLRLSTPTSTGGSPSSEEVTSSVGAVSS